MSSPRGVVCHSFLNTYQKTFRSKQGRNWLTPRFSCTWYWLQTLLPAGQRSYL